jgi:hypothetical protein
MRDTPGNEAKQYGSRQRNAAPLLGHDENSHGKIAVLLLHVPHFDQVYQGLK